jgi:hypothetical protein
MPTHEDTSLLTDRLCSLAGSQLQIQTSRSSALDTAALGVMALDVGLATIILSSRTTHLGPAALTLLGLSFGLAAAVLSLPDAGQTGPSVADTIAVRQTEDDRRLEDSFLTELAEDLSANERALARKAPLFNAALALLLLALFIDLTGTL